MKNNNKRRTPQGGGPAQPQPAQPADANALTKPEREQPTEAWFWATRSAQKAIGNLGAAAFCVAMVLAVKANLRGGPHPYGLALGDALLDPV